MKETRSVLITQSNYIPWKGYFDSIALADVFVVYDEMQYTKRDWRNRNLIQTPQGLKWLTIPVEVSGKFNQKIKDTKIADPNWNQNHWHTIKNTYGKSAGFKDVADWLADLYGTCTHHYLSEINLHFIRAFNQFFQIKTEILSSSDFDLADDRNERLVNICKRVEAGLYYSGPAAKNYMDVSLFAAQNIAVEYLDYSGYTSYIQQNTPFEHGVSVVDLLCTMGDAAPTYLKYKP